MVVVVEDVVRGVVAVVVDVDVDVVVVCLLPTPASLKEYR